MPHEIAPDAIRKTAGLALARTERLSETGASATLRITGILKFAPDRSESELLCWLEKQLGPAHALCLPRFRDLGEVDGSFVTELEYLGDSTFEAVLANPTRYCAIEPSAVVERVGEILARFGALRVPSDMLSSSVDATLEEIIEAISHNAMRAGSSFIPDADICHRRAAFVPGVCHRDLSAPNVMCGSNGDVRLIDPRTRMPGASAGPPAFGSAAIDAAAFLVSLERKELEGKRKGLPPFALAERFQDIIAGLVEKGAFNEFMFDLCRAHAYSVYAACRCDYCLAIERAWLHDLMRERFEASLCRIV